MLLPSKNGLTQEKLGKLWGMQQANAGKILNGNVGLKYSYLELFANQVGMSVVDVITVVQHADHSSLKITSMYALHKEIDITRDIYSAAIEM